MAAEVGEIKRETGLSWRCVKLPQPEFKSNASVTEKKISGYEKILHQKLIKANTGYKINYIDIVKFIGKGSYSENL